VVCSCNKSDVTSKEKNHITITVKAEEALSEIKMSDIFSTVEYIPLETSDEHLIGEIAIMTQI
jgi:tellurite resistance protein